jgi:ferredoxin
MFRVIIDPDTCESNAFCVGFAPDVFELGDDSPPVHVLAVTVGDDRRSAVEDAVRNCPRQAIRIESDDAGGLDG